MNNWGEGMLDREMGWRGDGGVNRGAKRLSLSASQLSEGFIYTSAVFMCIFF